MKIVATILAGNNEKIIRDAVVSVVDWVDYILLIDTGITDNTKDIVKDVAKGKYHERFFEWCNDFSAARNYALEQSSALDAGWVITLDTDERIILNGGDLRKSMEITSSDCLLLSDDSRTYNKARCFRLPVKEKYSGPTHEAFPAYNLKSEVEPICVFTEVAKTPEQLSHKFYRDISILEKHTKKNPLDPRWWYYLGESYKNAGKIIEAIGAYNKCFDLNGWDEESAWSMYKTAECHISQENYQLALESCAKGIGRHPGLADLYWLSGWCCFKLGKIEHAIIWSRQAINMGLYNGHGNSFNRIGFRHPPALFEGPYDVLRWCGKVTNNKELERWAEDEFKKSMAKRTI